jgi:hypothetical protein
MVVERLSGLFLKPVLRISSAVWCSCVPQPSGAEAQCRCLRTSARCTVPLAARTGMTLHLQEKESLLAICACPARPWIQRENPLLHCAAVCSAWCTDASRCTKACIQQAKPLQPPARSAAGVHTSVRSTMLQRCTVLCGGLAEM